MSKSVEERFANVRLQFDLRRLEYKFESVVRDLPEVGVSSIERAKPSVLEQARAPSRRKFLAFAGENVLDRSFDGAGVEDGEGVKADGLDLASACLSLS